MEVLVVSYKQQEIEKMVYDVASKMGAEVVRNYGCYGNEKYPDAVSLYFELAYCCARRKIRISNHTEQHKDVAFQKDLKSITIYEDTSPDRLKSYIFVFQRID